ncbi:MAG: ParA family protein [Oscillospiraceae bacterium]|jgi:MinD superfamily P-loop ATPase|nr:ParA family protein [Oscillospiraceae bacterium]
MSIKIPEFLIICGHYGTGKTNLSLNLAVEQAKSGKRVSLVDMDIVNPFLRSSDYGKLLELYGIRLISPKFAGSSLDAPGLPAEILAAFDRKQSEDSATIIDAGGDPAGATVLGRFAKRIRAGGYEMWYVINKSRPEAATPTDAAELLTEIETISRLSATGVVNNTHLMGETTRETVVGSMLFARETAARLELPLIMVTAPRAIASELTQKNVFPIDVYIKTPW